MPNAANWGAKLPARKMADAPRRPGHYAAVAACRGREDIIGPVNPVAFKPGTGAFCSPDLDKKADKKECREFLETVNEPRVPAS